MKLTEAEISLYVVLHFEFSLLNQYLAKPSCKFHLCVLLLKIKNRVLNVFSILQVVFS